MTKAQELPIYKQSYELLLQLTKLTQNFPRNFKIGIASDLSKNAQDVVLYVFKVNVSKDINDKIVFIEYIIDRLTAINLLLRVSTDLKLISPAQFGNISIMAVNVLKQAQGWLKYYRPLTSKHV